MHIVADQYSLLVYWKGKTDKIMYESWDIGLIEVDEFTVAVAIESLVGRNPYSSVVVSIHLRSEETCSQECLSKLAALCVKQVDAPDAGNNHGA